MKGFDDPDTAQRKAAAPRASVWVSASAGTGKTRVLIDRLLWLMLDGTDPARILCLTFTRAAAAEMSNRLNEELAKWATSRSGALAQSLQQADGADARRRNDRPGAAALRAGSRHPRRHKDRDASRVLPNTVAPLPAGGRRTGRIYGHGRAQRARSPDRSRRARHRRRAQDGNDRSSPRRSEWWPAMPPKSVSAC